LGLYYPLRAISGKLPKSGATLKINDMAVGDRIRNARHGWALLLLVATLCWVATSAAADLHGKVVAVSDGDTVTVLDADNHQHKIRLAGIDAPEKAQAFGQASKKSLSDLIYGRLVDVNWDKHDRYGRIIGKIMVGDADICLEQIRRGMAWHYKQYQRDQSAADRVAYGAAEETARASHAGLWRDPVPIPPWQFRHR